MTDKAHIKKIYPSSLGFAWGELVFTESNSGCVRYLQLSEGAPRGDIHELYKYIGDYNERLYEETIEGDYRREHPFKRKIGSNAVLSGRVDFLLPDSVSELKATFSRNTFNSAKKGYYKLNHLAQLSIYLANFNMKKGNLVYGLFQHNKENEIVLSERVDLQVDVCDNGSIKVDGRKADYTVKDAIRHVLLQAKYKQNKEELAPRPANYSSFKSPCRFCPLATLCDAHEKGDLRSYELHEASYEVLEEVSKDVTNEPRITKMR